MPARFAGIKEKLMTTKTVIILVLFLLLNLFSFLLMRHDKQCAKKNRRRVPEKTLFLSAILFGALGGTLGMFLFRHKTKHWYFRVFFPLLMVVQAVLLGYLWSRGLIA